MNSLKIERLIMSHFMKWEHFNQTRTARANRNFTPPVSGIWYRISILGGINHIASLSDRPCVREVGTLIVQIFDDDGNGTKNIKQTADSLAKHLGCTMLDDLELLAPSVIDVGASGDYYQINVSVPYRYY
ncbi:phage tail terminator-like protein [Moraxella bovoculi]|uniref:phage tail terminator-like protein n=1 Tax=Moraxella bovoculi TaxID=386891 RepID=UPI000624930A|nr:phage tail terminator-like protein [Moraxella bovoculi]AKG14164.1 hypothetical protein AAX11_09215 [Moraxella bovoculi]